jgi:hypothetical protein
LVANAQDDDDSTLTISYVFVRLFDLQAEDHTIGREEGGRISTTVGSGEKASISASVSKDD